MTIRMPEADLPDKILQLFGKRRAVKMPDGTYHKFGPYAYAHAIKEGFWRALLRPKGQDPPEGYVYPDNVFKHPNEGDLNDHNQ